MAAVNWDHEASRRVPVPGFVLGVLGGLMVKKLPILAACGLAFLPLSATAIVGGDAAAENEFPFMVSIRGPNHTHICGGSLIRKNWVLTAAHCINGDGALVSEVLIGLNDYDHPGDKAETRFKVNVFKHPQFNRTTLDFDFALILLDSESKINPIGLNKEELAAPADLVAAGWGLMDANQFGQAVKVKPGKLQRVTLPFVPTEVCGKANAPDEVTASMICAGVVSGGKGTCVGDSGGPLVKGDVLVGVNSGVSEKGCAVPNFYPVFGKVSAAASWIEKTIDDAARQDTAAAAGDAAAKASMATVSRRVSGILAP
jgi:trypsin